MTKGTHRFFRPSMNWLLVFIPVTLSMEHAMPDRPVLVFLCAACSIGGLLNATFGNAPELIISFVALRSGFTDMVRASLVGAILANLLLGLGLTFLLGGFRYHVQEFNPRAAGMQASMMMLAVISMMVPGSFHTLVTEETLRYERYLNTGIAIVLLGSYALSLLFMIRNHPDFFQSDRGRAEEEEHRWSIGKAVGLLVAASVLAAWMSEILVGASRGRRRTLAYQRCLSALSCWLWWAGQRNSALPS